MATGWHGCGAIRLAVNHEQAEYKAKVDAEAAQAEAAEAAATTKEGRRRLRHLRRERRKAEHARREAALSLELEKVREVALVWTG